MPSRLRPVASVAAEAVLVGDPGRALLLAQELLQAPKMSNHARGLWGYWGETSDGRELTVQSTGMGGPSAALVLADLAKLGLRRAIRVGTCAALEPTRRVGELVDVVEAHAWGGLGGGEGEPTLPDRALGAALRRELGVSARPATIASLDTLHGEHPDPAQLRAEAADMQTAALLGHGAALGVALAAVLIVTEDAAGRRAGDDLVEEAAKRAGKAAAAALGS